jgi:hypothetical protein
MGGALVREVVLHELASEHADYEFDVTLRLSDILIRLDEGGAATVSLAIVLLAQNDWSANASFIR